MASFRSHLLLGSALLFALPAALRAQTDAPPQVSEAISAELGKLRELVGAKSYAPALATIARLLPTVPADSYDRTLLSQIQAQIFLTEGNYSAAIAPLETALKNGERLGHLPAATLTDSLFLLAQLHQQQASETKDVARQLAALDRSIAYLRRWQRQVHLPTAEGQLFAASLFYQKATLDPSRLDTAALAESRRAAEEGLVVQIKPPNSLYVLILAALQQTGDHAAAADFLELLVEKNPANTGYWQQLASTYLTLAGSAKNEREAARYNLRALLAIERAQARGLLNSPKENFNRVALYLTLRQFDPAIALLEQGLAAGTLENTRRNWELLANSYQQTRRDPQAIAALEKAVASLPADAQLEFALAQLLYAATRPADARAHLERAIEKGRLDKPGQTRLFLAYICLELLAYDDAARWVRDAGSFEDVKKDDLARLAKAIDEARARPAAVSKS